MISSSESSVNWWESDGPMKGIYQGNEFDVEGPPCNFIFLCNHNRNSQKILGATRGTNDNAQTTLQYDCTWFLRR